MTPILPASPIDEAYLLMEHRLGRGSFSEVRLAIKRAGNERVAVKVVNKRSAELDIRVKQEIDLLKQCARLPARNA